MALDPPGDLSALMRSVLIGKRPSVETLVSCLHQQEASLLKTELSESPSYLRSGTPASRKQLLASELLSALLRGQIGVGGRCEWMHAITPGFSQDWTRVSSHSERERTEQRCLPVPCVTQDLPRFFTRYHSPPADQARILRPRAKSVCTFVPSGALQAVVGF